MSAFAPPPLARQLGSSVPEAKRCVRGCRPAYDSPSIGVACHETGRACRLSFETLERVLQRRGCRPQTQSASQVKVRFSMRAVSWPHPHSSVAYAAVRFVQAELRRLAAGTRFALGVGRERLWLNHKVQRLMWRCVQSMLFCAG